MKKGISATCLWLSQAVLLFDWWRTVSNSLCRLRTNPVRINSFIIHLVSSWNLLPTRRRLNGEALCEIYCLVHLFLITMPDSKLFFCPEYKYRGFAWATSPPVDESEVVVITWVAERCFLFFPALFLRRRPEAACRCSTHSCQHVQAERHLQ